MKKIFQKYKELIRYLLVGMCTTFVSLGVYLALVNTILTHKFISKMFKWHIAESQLDFDS